MAQVHVFVSPAPSKDIPYQLMRTQFFDRIPCVGELVFLGLDEGGQEANYEVVVVHHIRVEGNVIDAEIYLKRIDATKIIKERIAVAVQTSDFLNRHEPPTFKD